MVFYFEVLSRKILHTPLLWSVDLRRWHSDCLWFITLLLLMCSDYVIYINIWTYYYFWIIFDWDTEVSRTLYSCKVHETRQLERGQERSIKNSYLIQVANVHRRSTLEVWLHKLWICAFGVVLSVLQLETGCEFLSVVSFNIYLQYLLCINVGSFSDIWNIQ